MVSKGGLGLKFLQWFVRGIQLGCAAVILGIFSYFLATMANHNIYIQNHIRAVEGIVGAATLYTIIALLLLCCLAGILFTSLIAIILDIAFAGAFGYVAWVNRNGATSCSGYVDTPYGRGRSGQDVLGDGGFTNLPSFRTACRLQTACFAVSIIAIFFFLLSAVVEFFLIRHHKKEKRFGPGPKNGYTSGSGRKGGMFSWRRKRQGVAPVDHDNTLPQHTTPNQVRHSYNTEATAVARPESGYAHDAAHKNNKFGESGYAHDTAHNTNMNAVANNNHNNDFVAQNDATAPTGRYGELGPGYDTSAHTAVPTTGQYDNSMPYDAGHNTDGHHPHLGHHDYQAQAPNSARYNDGVYDRV